MTKLVQNDIASLTNEQSALAALNSNYQALETFSDSVLSRDGTSPNTMLADLDMNSHKILNIGDPLDMNHAAIIGLDDGVGLTEPVTVNQLNNAIFSGGGASAALPFITVSNSASLSAERALAAGTGLSLADGGANSSITINPNFTTFRDQIYALGDSLWGPGRALTLSSTPTTLVATDSGKAIINFNANRTVNLPVPSSGLCYSFSTIDGGSGSNLTINVNTGLILLPDGTNTASLLIVHPQRMLVVSDGANWIAYGLLNGDILAVENLSTNGMVARTASNTWTTRTITGTANEITSTNGDGVSGNPTLSLPTSLTFTGKTVTGGSYSSPALTTPTLGTPSSGNLSSCTGYTESFVIACSDETTALTTGTGKIKFRMPYAFNVVTVRASLSTAQTSGSIFTVDINESGTSIISTKLTIDNTELTSTTAVTAAVISDSSIADDAEMSVDIDQIGDGTAKGLKVYLIGRR